MKRLLGLFVASVLMTASAGFASVQDTVKEATKDVGRQTKRAAKATGKTVKKTTKKVVHKGSKETKTDSKK